MRGEIIRIKHTRIPINQPVTRFLRINLQRISKRFEPKNSHTHTQKSSEWLINVHQKKKKGAASLIIRETQAKTIARPAIPTVKAPIKRTGNTKPHALPKAERPQSLCMRCVSRMAL